MTRRARLGACLAWMGLLSLPPIAAVAETSKVSADNPQVVWRMPSEYPPSTMPGEGLAAFARLAAERSGGRLAVVPSFDATAGLRSAAMIGAVEAGTVEAADAFTGPLAAVDPVFALSSLPFLATSIEDARALAAIARPAYARALAAHGQRLLYVTPWAPSGIWSRQALNDVADLKSLRIRTYDAISTTVLAAAGAQAVNLSQADAIPQVKAGAVDAMLSSGDGGVGRRLWEQLPHFTAVQYAMPISIAVVSLRAYEALPEPVATGRRCGGHGDRDAPMGCDPHPPRREFFPNAPERRRHRRSAGAGDHRGPRHGRRGGGGRLGEGDRAGRRADPGGVSGALTPARLDWQIVGAEPANTSAASAYAIA